LPTPKPFWRNRVLPCRDADEVDGGLPVAANPAMSVAVVPDALRLFRQSYPSVRVTVQTNETSVITKWTAAGFCDFALSSFVPDPHPGGGQAAQSTARSLPRARRSSPRSETQDSCVRLAGRVLHLTPGTRAGNALD
jgi:DNA-binding transcriptional LysR family regulator